MKKIYILLVAIVGLAIISLIIFIPWIGDPTVENLTVQLNGGRCSFETYSYSLEPNGYNSSKPPQKRSLFKDWSSQDIGLRRNDREQCILDAIRLFPEVDTKGQDIVPILLEALKKYPNVDTGDGIIYFRSATALALGKIGDKRALSLLQDILNSPDLAEASPYGGFPSGYEFEKGSSHKAVREAIAQINSK